MILETITFDGKKFIPLHGGFNPRHGGPFDRGSADSWYSRPRDPHYYVGDTYSSTRIDEVDMSKAEVEAYLAGYEHNEQFGDKKVY